MSALLRPRRALDPWWMLAPTLALLAAFFFWPLAFAAWRSLYEWDLLTEPRFVGLRNYGALIESGRLGGALATTFSFSVVVVVGSSALGLALAVALNRPGRFAAAVRGAIFSAYVVSWVSVALLFLWILDADAGVANAALAAVGGPRVRWLSDPSVALHALAGVTIWKIAGYSMVLFLAGLQDVPRSLLEAAALDGAGPWRRFWRITWPLLRPTAAFVVTTSLIASFQVFDVVRVMTQGGPVDATMVLVYAVYEEIFQNLRVGRASALVVVFFVLLVAATSLQLRVWRGRAST